MLSSGVDIIEISRMQRALSRWGERFLNHIYTPAEVALCRGKAPALAVRFAAKEAVTKALGVRILGWGHGTIKWHEIEILPDKEGKPIVYLHGRAEQRANEMGLKELALSLTDTENLALASVIGVISGRRSEDC